MHHLRRLHQGLPGWFDYQEGFPRPLWCTRKYMYKIFYCHGIDTCNVIGDTIL
jgi:hypothetical protein